MGYDDEWTSADTARAVWRTIWVVVGSVVLLGTLWFVSWKLDWFIYQKDVEKQAQINETNSGTQQHRADRVRQLIRDFSVINVDNEAGRAGIRNEACDLIPRLSDAFLTDDIRDFSNQEC